MPTNPFYSTDINADTNVLDFSEVLAAALYADQKLIGRIKIGEAITDDEYFWIEETRYPDTIQLAEAVTEDEGTGIAVDSTDGLEVDCIIKHPSYAPTYKVTAVDSTSSPKTFDFVAVGDGGIAADHAGPGFAAGWADNDVLDILFWPRVEGSEAVGNRIKSTVACSNVPMVFRYDMSATRKQITRNMHALDDFWAHNVTLRTKDIKRDMSRAVFYSVLQATAAPTSPMRMKGVRSWITDPTYTDVGSGTRVGNVDSTSQPFSLSVPFDLTSAILDTGSEGDNGRFVMGVSPGQADVISVLAEDKIRYDPEAQTRGTYVGSLKHPRGVMLDIVYDPMIYDHDLFILKMSNISLHPYQGAAWFAKHYSTSFDGVQAGIIGEWTCKVINADQEFGIATGLTI